METKKYTSKRDKIIDNETGAELDINTNKLADKSGIKADLVQGENPIEVKVTPKKDVKEKFAKKFKKSINGWNSNIIYSRNYIWWRSSKKCI